MAVRIETCSDCGAKLEVATVQAVCDGKLSWYRSYRCDSCGAAIEEDGIGAPKDIREELIGTEGAWIVKVDSVANRAKAISVARRYLDLSMDEVRKFRVFDPLCVAYGTRTEMEWVKTSLDELGITATLREAPVTELHAIGEG